MASKIDIYGLALDEFRERKCAHVDIYPPYKNFKYKEKKFNMVDNLPLTLEAVKRLPKTGGAKTFEPTTEEKAMWPILSGTEQMKAIWLAALIDGEGVISIRLDKFIDSFGVVGPKILITPQIMVCNTYIPLLQLVQLVVGQGTINEKGTQYWHIHGWARCENLLNKILPYLVVKQENAKKLLAFITYRRSVRNNTLPNEVRRYTEKDLQYVIEIRQLQHKNSARSQARYMASKRLELLKQQILWR